ncbi:hypothetical protein DI272_32390 [Streptomyces sp. Act143]|nr:hypothetical protein DI272_32390 [Streptomyces sp. Act143]
MPTPAPALTPAPPTLPTLTTILCSSRFGRSVAVTAKEPARSPSGGPDGAVRAPWEATRVGLRGCAVTGRGRRPGPRPARSAGPG